jgi:hypothetical protein
MARLQIGIEQFKIGPNAGKWLVFAIMNDTPYILTLGGWKIRDSAIQPDGIMVWNEKEGAKNAVMKYGMELFK